MDKLHDSFHKNMSNLSKVVKQFPWESAFCYAQWLRDSHEYVNHSTRILAHAAAVMPSHYSVFADRFITHAHEEKGHEKLLIKDLKNLGFKLEELPASLEMQFFHQSLYYWLSHQGNVMGLFGWIFTLEGIAVEVGEYMYKMSSEAHGRNTASFLKVHTSEDPHHLEKAFQTVRELSIEDQEVVISALNQYSSMYCLLLERIESMSKNNASIAS